MAAVTSSGFWSDQGTGYALLVNKAPTRARLQRAVGVEGFRKIKELFDTAIGAAAGEAANASYKRVAGETSNDVGGGSRVVETVTVINRNTDAADITALKEMVVNVSRRPATYPRDLSGNGGGTF
jgi:hypothetical protein